jgi:hypothetical protein
MEIDLELSELMQGKLDLLVEQVIAKLRSRGLACTMRDRSIQG